MLINAEYVNNTPIKPQPNMLKILPIILSITSQNIYPLFLFYSHFIFYIILLL